MRSLIFTNEFYTVADAGGILGDAANAMSFTRFLINVGYSVSTGKDAVNSIKPYSSSDTTVQGKNSVFWIYDTNELEERGRYKENPKE